ncbi:OmpA family protein [Massilia consociata]|uniref:OmpA family protein n=1 Tax=Massilia consociata TaxID=760117 RepID=A0ABV6FK62_9BURK
MALGLVLAAPAPVTAQQLRNAPGGADTPVLSRYQGSILYAFGEESVGSAQVVEADKGKPVVRAAEGKISNRFYWSPVGTSPLEIYRNYRQALEAAGYQIAYACEEAKCRQDGTQPLVAGLPEAAKWTESDALVRSIFNSGNQQGFYLISARKPAGSGFQRVQVATSLSNLSPPYEKRVRQFVQVIEPATVQTGKVTVDANAIGDALKRDGRIALYGVLFDTNKASLRADSDEQLKQMAKALADAPGAKVFIVGHTDNQGDFENNMGLSQRRAQAVADALASRFGVAANRMTARGVASLAPVASNQSEDSRARNRRVELVLR